MSAPLVRYTTTGLHISNAAGNGSADLDILEILDKWGQGACSGSIERAIDRLRAVGISVATDEVNRDGANASKSALRLLPTLC